MTSYLVTEVTPNWRGLEGAAWRSKGWSRNLGRRQSRIDGKDASDGLVSVRSAGGTVDSRTNTFSGNPTSNGWRLTNTAERQEGGVSGNTQVSAVSA